MAALKTWDEVGAEQKAAGIVWHRLPFPPGPEYYERLRREHQEWCEADAEGMARRRTLFIANNPDMMATVLAEEERWGKRMAGADRLFDKVIKPLEAECKTVIPGEVAFFLHDTHGIKIDIAREMAAERGLTIDEEGFEQAMEEQRQRSRPEKVGLQRGV